MTQQPSTHLVKRILNLEYVEMSNLCLQDIQITMVPGQPPLPPKKPIQDILCGWRNSPCWPLFSHHGSWRRRQSYSPTRCQLCEQNTPSIPTAVGCLRSVLLPRNLNNKSLDWSLLNSRLIMRCSQGNARSIPSCSHCFQEDNLVNLPMQPSKLLNSNATATAHQPQSSQERYKEGRCRNTAKYMQVHP